MTKTEKAAAPRDVLALHGDSREGRAKAMSAPQPRHDPLCRWEPSDRCTCGLDKLRAEVADLKRRIRLARKLFARDYAVSSAFDRPMRDALDLRKPLPRCRR